MIVKEKKPQNYWNNYKHCYEVAKTCSTRQEMNIKYPQASRWARKNKWLDEWFPKISRKYWSKERILEFASNFNNKTDFRKASSAAYSIAHKNGWLKLMTWMHKVKTPFEYESDSVYVYIFEDYKTAYVGRTLSYRKTTRDREHIFDTKDVVCRFAIDNKIAVPEPIILEDNISIKDGLIKEDEWRMKYEEMGYKLLNKMPTGLNTGSVGSLNTRHWTKNKCYQEALKYNTIKDFRANSNSAYTISCMHHWNKEYTWLINKRNIRYKYSYKQLKELVKQYKNPKELENNNHGAYNAILKYGFLDEFFPNRRRFHKKYTLDEVLKEASKYYNATDFITNKGGMYSAAKKHGWLKYLRYKTPHNINTLF